MIRQVAAILWKDLLAEFRTKQMLLSMLVFSLMVAVLFSLSFPPGSKFIHEAVPGILWMTFIFVSLLGLNRSFSDEVDKGSLQGLLIAPIDRNSIYIGKLLANLIFISLVEFVALPFFGLFFNFDWLHSLGSLLAVILLSTLGFSIVGTLFSAISVNARSREVMLPILHFPVTIPLMIAAVQATSAVLRQAAFGEVWDWLKIIIVFDAIFFIVALLTFEYIVEE